VVSKVVFAAYATEIVTLEAAPACDTPPDARVAVDIAMMVVPAINLGSTPFLNAFISLPSFAFLNF
jgi:hypothetical protein